MGFKLPMDKCVHVLVRVKRTVYLHDATMHRLNKLSDLGC